MDQTKTGALIRAQRLRRGMTQLQLAGQIGVSDKTVSKWERGCGAPDIELLPALSAALATSNPHWANVLEGRARSKIATSNVLTISIRSFLLTDPATLSAASALYSFLFLIFIVFIIKLAVIII